MKRGPSSGGPVRPAVHWWAGCAPESADHAGRDPVADRLVGELDRLVPLARRIIDQAERRVSRAKKVASPIEPHAAVIPRHKARQSVEFGRKLWLAEVDGGIITELSCMRLFPFHRVAKTAR